ncbi:MAG TPA: isocitrate lyase/phosphoenolpyruvate mutase family protein [Phenylobacterium sp.]|nr:isocitrate lyase/phosphoenolpyruvate mutase family protein [Phenylobacterium sp.]
MSSLSQSEAARRFLALHAGPRGFVLPNAWDAGSAMVLAAEGFPAIATTSAGIAFSLGKPDYQVADVSRSVSRTEMFDRIRQIVEAVEAPVSADLEAGFGDSPEAVAETIRLAIEAGLAGGNIEDKIPGRDALYDEALAVERIAAARAAVEASGTAFVLNARTDALLLPSVGLDAAIRRGALFLAAGADCVFTPGAVDPETVGTLVREIPGPLNVVMSLGTSSGNAHELIALGVQRVTVGGGIARSALAFVRRAAQELRDQGTVGFARDQMSGGDLNRLFDGGDGS